MVLVPDETPITSRDSTREILSWLEFGEAARDLAQDVLASGFRPDVIVAIARGGLVLAGAIAYALDTKMCGSINVEFYTGVNSVLEKPVVLPPALDAPALAGKRVLLVDDVSDSGRTLQLVRDLLREIGADVHTVCLYAKPRTILQPDHVWRHTADWITFPWSALPPGDGVDVSIHLVGGGWSGGSDDSDDSGGSTEVYELFVAEAAARAARLGRSVPRIAVLVVVEDDVPSAEFRENYPAMLASVGPSEPLVTEVAAGETFDTRVLSDIDALLVAGGMTPAYFEAVMPIVDQVRLLVGDGLPYLGFSAGAMIAADTAILGGYKIGGVEVCPSDAAEDLDEVTLVQGLGLVDLAIDVHAAQWGTLTRLIAATEAGIISGGVAIDENTALVVGEGALVVIGSGSVWRVEPQIDDDGEITGVSVGTLGVE